MYSFLSREALLFALLFGLIIIIIIIIIIIPFQVRPDMVLGPPVPGRKVGKDIQSLSYEVIWSG